MGDEVLDQFGFGGCGLELGSHVVVTDVVTIEERRQLGSLVSSQVADVVRTERFIPLVVVGAPHRDMVALHLRSR